MGVIYKLTFPNGKAYVGFTKKTLEHRFAQHIKNAELNRNKSPYVENAIRKHGVTNIISEVLMECEYDWELPNWEIAFIAEHNTVCPNGYNLTKGGDGNSSKHTLEYKLNKSKHMRKNKKEEHLEMYVKYQKTKHGSEGYIVQKPDQDGKKFKSRQFCDPNLRMEEKLRLANEYAIQLENGTAVDINRYKHIDIGYDNIPKGICYLTKFDGFRVDPPDGRPRKWFKRKTQTRNEKYALAVAYCNNV
jgi:hypothetical protein